MVNSGYYQGTFPQGPPQASQGPPGYYQGQVPQSIPTYQSQSGYDQNASNQNALPYTGQQPQHLQPSYGQPQDARPHSQSAYEEPAQNPMSQQGHAAPAKPDNIARPTLQHIFAALADYKQQNISLTISRDRDKGVNALKPTENEDSPAAFLIKGRDYGGRANRGPMICPNEAESFIATWSQHSFHHDSLEFEFAESATRPRDVRKWGFDPDKKGEDGAWTSHVGFLPGSKLVWNCEDLRRDKNEQKLNAWCQDFEGKYGIVCKIKMFSFDDGVITLPLALFTKQEWLEEMLTVGFAVVSRIREKQLEDTKSYYRHHYN